MRWAERNKTAYLLRKSGKAEISLGPRSPETEAAYQAFVNGRERNRDRTRGLAARLDQLAPVNVAMGIGRVPAVAAQILRLCDEQGLLGRQLLVVGTSAIYAYEALAGVQIQGNIVATGDIDLLFDARRHLSIAVEGVRTGGLIGLLRKVDRSFEPIRPRAFRASNRDGYLVDLIRPQAKDVFRDRRSTALTALADDLDGAAIFGLDWLINSPRLEAVAIDERGYPVRMVVIDPRAFALHKAWVSSRPDRSAVNAMRDLQQAQTVAALATRYLRRSFEALELNALPQALRDLASKLTVTEADDASRSGQPNW